MTVNSLADRYALTRAAVVAEESRVGRVRHQLEAKLQDGRRFSLRVAGRRFEGLVEGCFDLVGRLERLVDHGVLVAAELTNDAFIDLHVTNVLERPASNTRLVREWEEHELTEWAEQLRLVQTMLTSLADEKRQLLSFVAVGAGQIVEVFGRLEAADHVVIVVPGVGNSARNFLTLAERASRLHDVVTATAGGGSVATVAWLGYRPPAGFDVLDAAEEELARAGALALSSFIAELASIAPPISRRTVVAHSYGSVVAGLAAREHGLDVHALVVLGSPGMGVDNASQLRLLAGGPVWAGRARNDPITFVSELKMVGRRIHGSSPYAVDFGSRVVEIDGDGHSTYLRDDVPLSQIASILVRPPEP